MKSKYTCIMITDEDSLEAIQHGDYFHDDKILIINNIVTDELEIGCNLYLTKGGESSRDAITIATFPDGRALFFAARKKPITFWGTWIDGEMKIKMGDGKLIEINGKFSGENKYIL